MQAKDLFKILVREQLGALLRSEGFRGSGQAWRLEHPSGNAALIQVQRDRYNTADRVEFTINLAVASKVVWDWQLTREPWRGPTAKPSAMYVNDCPLWLRIGTSSSEGRGEGAWWTITTGMRLAPLAASLGEALRGRAIPLLRDHLTDAALCRWLEAHDPQLGWPPDTWRLLYLSVLLAAQGPRDGWTRSLSSCRTKPCMIRVRPGWLSTSPTCASAPRRQQQTVPALHLLPTRPCLTPPGDGGWLPGATEGVEGGIVAERVRVRELSSPGRQPAAADRAARLRLGSDRVLHLYGQMDATVDVEPCCPWRPPQRAGPCSILSNLSTALCSVGRSCQSVEPA